MESGGVRERIGGRDGRVRSWEGMMMRRGAKGLQNGAMGRVWAAALLAGGGQWRRRSWCGGRAKGRRELQRAAGERNNNGRRMPSCEKNIVCVQRSVGKAWGRRGGTMRQQVEAAEAGQVGA
ncbi:hypothetical protein J1614_011181 [Plenodomus biglobosus]|nr:hypothetical protein J1614_011181 [Plenodomus biglobosus]